MYSWPPIYFVWIQLLCLCWILIIWLKPNQSNKRSVVQWYPDGECSLVEVIDIWTVCPALLLLILFTNCLRNIRCHHRHLRKIDCLLAKVGRPAAGAECGGKSIHLPHMWRQKVLHSGCCGWRYNYYSQQRQSGQWAVYFS